MVMSKKLKTLALVELAAFNINMNETVLNLENRNALDEPMFFGKPLGIQRYDEIKYPEFARSYDVQLSNMWRPQEINMSSDLACYEKLNDVEKFVFESNLKFQTAGDSLLSRSIDAIKAHVTNTELEYAMNVWGLMENIHSESYTHVLKGITKDPKPFFDSILEDEKLVDRMSAIIEPFNNLLDSNSDDCEKTKVFKSVLALQIAEGVLFYTSFACSFFFAKNGKMTQNGKIIGLIKRDESEHQAITQNIIKKWNNDEAEGFKDILEKHRDYIYKAYAIALEGEQKWAEYLFSKGEMVGLTEKSLNGYSEYNVRMRLRSLGYSSEEFTKATGKELTKTNPIPWLNKFMDSSRVQIAPQESEITSYKKMGTENDLGSSLGNLKF